MPTPGSFSRDARDGGVHARLSGAGRIALDGFRHADTPGATPLKTSQSGVAGRRDAAWPPSIGRTEAATTSSWRPRAGPVTAAATPSMARSVSTPTGLTKGRHSLNAAASISWCTGDPISEDAWVSEPDYGTSAWLCEANFHDTETSLPRGLGAIQPDGRAEVLRQWSQPAKGQTLPGRGQGAATEALRGALSMKAPSRVKGVTAPDLEWSSLNGRSRRALQDWVAGKIGGRHCQMVLEHDAAIALFISPLDRHEVTMSDLKCGAMLGALTGLPTDGQGGGWLYGEVFSKSVHQILEEALQAALSEALDPWHERNGGFSLEQVNLALRRHAMRAQALGLQSLTAPDARARSHRCADEYLRVQVWLELVRLHAEGVSEGAAQSAASAQFPKAGRTRGNTAQAPGTDRPGSSGTPQWDDRKFTREMSKPEAELEKDARQMSEQALRMQNRSIEAYLMRLVQQRDTIKHIARLAEQCDSYLVLGLDGPDASVDDIKRAYRTLARKEHPDKAGVENKERFQEIQKAYTTVLAQRRGETCAASAGLVSAPAASRDAETVVSIGATAISAAENAEMAKDAAEVVTSSAHRSFQLRARAGEARGLQKKAALRELQQLTRQGAAQLRCNMVNIRALYEHVTGVARCADAAMAEYGDWCERAMAGAGLKERVENMNEAGDSCLLTAEHLEKLSESDYSMLKMMEGAASGLDAAAAIRILSECISRTATVARCTADKAINIASSALELSCSLASLDRQYKLEKAEEAAERERERTQRPETPTGPMAAGMGGDGAANPGVGTVAERAPSADQQRRDRDAEKKDENKSQEQEGEGMQAALRVQNLKCLGSLNEEVLSLQVKLKSLLQRGQGLLPAVATVQKGDVFDLVQQLLNSATAEVARLAVDPNISTKQLLDQAFGFAIALEHTRDVALPAEVKTQVLRQAALLDVELLCQIIEGPFKKRLTAVGARRPSTSMGTSTTYTGRARAAVVGAGAVSDGWCDATNNLCHRITSGVREQLGPTKTES